MGLISVPSYGPRVFRETVGRNDSVTTNGRAPKKTTQRDAGASLPNKMAGTLNASGTPRIIESTRAQANKAHPAILATLGMENELAGITNATRLHRATASHAAKTALSVSNAITIASLPLSFVDQLLTVANGLALRKELKNAKRQLQQADALALQTLDADIARLEAEIKGLPEMTRDAALGALTWIRRAIMTAPGHVALGGVALGGTLGGLSAAISGSAAARAKRSANRGQAAALNVQEAIRNAPKTRLALPAESIQRLNQLHASGEISTNVYGLLRENPSMWLAIDSRAANRSVSASEWEELYRATHFSWQDRLGAALTLAKRTKGDSRVGRQAMRREVVQAFVEDPASVRRTRDNIHGFRLLPQKGATMEQMRRDRQYSKNLRAILASEQLNAPLSDDLSQGTLSDAFLARYRNFTQLEKAQVAKAMHFKGKWFPGFTCWKVQEDAAVLVSKEERIKIRYALARFISEGGDPNACGALRKAYALRIAPPITGGSASKEDALSTFVSEMQTVDLHGLAEERRHAQIQFIQSGLQVAGAAVTGAVPGVGASVAASFTSFYQIYAGLRARMRQASGNLKRTVNQEMLAAYAQLLASANVKQDEKNLAAPHTHDDASAGMSRASLALRLGERPIHHPPLLAHSAANAVKQWGDDRKETKDIQLLRDLGLTEVQLRLLAEKPHAQIHAWCLSYLFSARVRAPFAQTVIQNTAVRHAQQEIERDAAHQSTGTGYFNGDSSLGIRDVMHAKGYRLIRNFGTPGIDSLIWAIAQQLDGEAYSVNKDTSKKVYRVIAKLSRRGNTVGRAEEGGTSTKQTVYEALGRLTDKKQLAEVVRLCAEEWKINGTIDLTLARQEGRALKTDRVQVDARSTRTWFGMRRNKTRNMVICHDQQSHEFHAIAAFRPFGKISEGKTRRSPLGVLVGGRKR